MTEIETKYLFFTGKGGVGKTSLACATAVEMADAGKNVFLVSTDPASNLKDVLENPSGASCLGLASAPKSGKERYQNVVNRLKDASLTSFYIVARADNASLKEASRASDELKALGMSHQLLYVNGVFKAMDNQDHLAGKIEAMGSEQLNAIPDNLKSIPSKTFPLLPYNVLGIEKLRSLFNSDLQKLISEKVVAQMETLQIELKGIETLTQELCEHQQHGLIMTMGKGGVGKTITASAIAVLLAKKGHEVLLTTTDPAAHIQDFIEQLGELPSTLTVERIDPKVETQRYTEKILAHKGEGQSEEAKKLILEDLKSPWTEEVAVFHAFSKAIRMSKRKFVVIDTAPTGHTLLLLDTAGSYHRDIMRENVNASRLRTPYMSLQDQELSKLILVSLPETTPMREAGALQDDLKRAGIRPYAWLINQSLSMLSGISDPILKSRANAETKVIETIKTDYSEKIFGIPFIAEKELLPAILNSSIQIDVD